jgi:hypothetical protein
MNHPSASFLIEYPVQETPTNKNAVSRMAVKAAVKCQSKLGGASRIDFEQL